MLKDGALIRAFGVAAATMLPARQATRAVVLAASDAAARNAGSGLRIVAFVPNETQRLNSTARAGAEALSSSAWAVACLLLGRAVRLLPLPPQPTAAALAGAAVYGLETVLVSKSEAARRTHARPSETHSPSIPGV